MAAGSSVGFVADLRAEILKRTVGQLLTEETDSVILGIQGGALKDSVTLEMGDIAISLAKVTHADTTAKLCRWKKAVQAPAIDIRSLLKACYRIDMDRRSVGTDSMASAHSQPAPKRDGLMVE